MDVGVRVWLLQCMCVHPKMYVACQITWISALQSPPQLSQLNAVGPTFVRLVCRVSQA